MKTMTKVSPVTLKRSNRHRTKLRNRFQSLKIHREFSITVTTIERENKTIEIGLNPMQKISALILFLDSEIRIPFIPIKIEWEKNEKENENNSRY